MKLDLDQGISAAVHDFVLERSVVKEPARAFTSDPFWKGLQATGTRLWLDTGDIDAAARQWTQEFSALTTNNTLLNKEVQKGIYDTVIREAGGILGTLRGDQQVLEIAFILNALHGLRLVKVFGARVSVELHTATADDVDSAVAYGRRFARISPTHFIVKVPLTAAGLMATRILRREGIPVNFTLGFSARQNYIAARFARPSYVNVFLGRLNAYMADNALGDGLLVGEKATLASQAGVARASKGAAEPTLQIAASMRGGSQVRDLAGVDVMTMPLATASEARSSLDGKWQSRVRETYRVSLAPGVDDEAVRLSTLWDISDRDERLAGSLVDQEPSSAAELVERAHALGSGDLFPRLGEADLGALAADGKIPKHAKWSARIARGELAIDTLCTIAGLQSFTADQRALDDRIRRLVAG
jgi:transaldolase